MSGQEASATDLTWSYATILKAMKRRAAFGALKAKYVPSHGGSLDNKYAFSGLSLPTTVVVASVCAVGAIGVLVGLVLARKRSQRRGYSQL